MLGVGISTSDDVVATNATTTLVVVEVIATSVVVDDDDIATMATIAVARAALAAHTRLDPPGGCSGRRHLRDARYWLLGRA